MFRTITPGEMKRIETRAMEAGVCSGKALMEQAAQAVAQTVGDSRMGVINTLLAVCGVGNNGGDAMAALRMLAGNQLFRGDLHFVAFRYVCIVLAGQLSDDARRELEQLQQECPAVVVIRTDEDWRNRLEQATLGLEVSCVIDGLFGTGLCREVTGTAAELCRFVNELHGKGATVISVDIPSGVCGRTGRVLGVAVEADKTVTFHRPKPGLYLGEGFARSGQVIVADIGLPDQYDDADGLCLWDPSDVRAGTPVYAPLSHKGDHGRVALLCGSAGMAGAAAIAATAALRTGAGLVTVACPERILDTVQMLCPCATCLPLGPDAETAWPQFEALLKKADVLGMGCGLGQSPWAAAMVEKTLAWLSENSLPAVIDADALNLLAGMDAAAYDLSRCVLTPHPGEAARLLGETVAEITADAVESAEKLRLKYGAAVVLKGPATVMITGEGCALNTLGTPALGKGGSGDALTGVLCALLGLKARSGNQRPLVEVLQTGCGLHGLAGCMAQEKYGIRGVLATDLCGCLGRDVPEESGGFLSASSVIHRTECSSTRQTVAPSPESKTTDFHDPFGIGNAPYGGRSIYRNQYPEGWRFPAEEEEGFFEKMKSRIGGFFHRRRNRADVFDTIRRNDEDRRHCSSRGTRAGQRTRYRGYGNWYFGEGPGAVPDDPDTPSTGFERVTPEQVEKYRAEHGENLWGNRSADVFCSDGPTAGFEPVTPEQVEEYRAGRREEAAAALGRIVTVTVDRKAGETHPEHRDIVYPINYGYVQDVLADDNEWQDAYIYGETMPLDVFEGQVVAVIRRFDDVEDKWVVAAPGTRLTETEVRAATNFVEKYFDSEILCL